MTSPNTSINTPVTWVPSPRKGWFEYYHIGLALEALNDLDMGGRVTRLECVTSEEDNLLIRIFLDADGAPKEELYKVLESLGANQLWVGKPRRENGVETLFYVITRSVAYGVRYEFSFTGVSSGVEND